MLEVVAAMIEEGDRFLACQRPAHKARALQWEFPGGKVEAGETLEEALIRECREELAVTLCPKGRVTDLVYQYPDVTIHLTLIRAVIAEGKPQTLEHREIRFLTLAEAGSYPFCPADALFLGHLQALNPQVPLGAIPTGKV